MPKAMPVDRDFVFLLNAHDVDPGSFLPKIASQTQHGQPLRTSLRVNLQ